MSSNSGYFNSNQYAMTNNSDDSKKQPLSVFVDMHRAGAVSIPLPQTNE